MRSTAALQPGLAPMYVGMYTCTLRYLYEGAKLARPRLSCYRWPATWYCICIVLAPASDSPKEGPRQNKALWCLCCLRRKDILRYCMALARYVSVDACCFLRRCCCRPSGALSSHAMYMQCNYRLRGAQLPSILLSTTYRVSYHKSSGNSAPRCKAVSLTTT